MNPTQDALMQDTPAMLLAAGRGERMRPLTDRHPKPLLAVQGRPLLQWQLEALARDGCRRVLINTAWLGQQIQDHFGPQFPTAQGPLALSYSDEAADFGGALETAGGIARALPRLGEVLWLAPNPAHNPRGDFGLSAEGLALNLSADHPGPRHTYSTIGLYRAALFTAPWCDIAAGNPQGQAAALAPLLRRAMDAGRVTASLYTGRWTDVGTPERLAQLNKPLNEPQIGPIDAV